MNQNKEIMIVDDDQQIIDMISMYFENAGYRIRSFTSAINAVEAVKTAVPDLVILDIRMPDLNGLDVLKQMKAINRDIPVVLLTGLHDEAMAKEAFELQALDYVTKPIDMNYLMTIVNSQLMENP